jgi:hypothetical protein
LAQDSEAHLKPERYRFNLGNVPAYPSLEEDKKKHAQSNKLLLATAQNPYENMSFQGKAIAAAKMVPSLLAGDAKAAFQKLTSDPAFIAQIAGLVAAFAAIQAIPGLGQAVDIALAAWIGVEGAWHLGHFLWNAYKAKDEAGVKAAAVELAKFIKVVGVVAVLKVIKLATKALKLVLGKRGGPAGTPSANSLQQGLYTPQTAQKLLKSKKGNLVLELFGGKKGKVPGAVNVSIDAQKGIKADLLKDKLSFVPSNSVNEIVAFNPYINKAAGGTGIMDYLPEAARVLKAGGRIIISGTKGNKFAQIKGSINLQKMNLRVVAQKIPLPNRFKDLNFHRIDGSELPKDSMVTTILEKTK